MAKKLPYQEGDWFVVRLPHGGLSMGVIARMNGKGIVLGYFYVFSANRAYTLSDAMILRPIDALLVRLFGDLGLLRREWELLGRIHDWNRNDWLLPAFGHRDLITGIPWKRIYEDDLLTLREEYIVSEDEFATLPIDALSGSKAVELILDQIIVRSSMSDSF